MVLPCHINIIAEVSFIISLAFHIAAYFPFALKESGILIFVLQSSFSILLRFPRVLTLKSDIDSNFFKMTINSLRNCAKINIFIHFGCSVQIHPNTTP